MGNPRHNYAAILRQRARDAAEARDAASPLSLTAYRAQRARDAWRAEYARRGGQDAPRLVATVGDLDRRGSASAESSETTTGD